MSIKDSIKFEQNLYNLINTCGLPVDTAFYILKSVYLDFQRTLLEYSDKTDNEGYSMEEQNFDVNPGTISVNINK